MVQRKSIKKSIKFEVLKRDSFTCQYCGKSAPNVVLEIDHILPVSKGGTNAILNLVTSCYDCNRGKAGKLLTDNSAINAQKLQLKLLNEKKSQFEMIKKWREEIYDLDNEQFRYIREIWYDKTGYDFNNNGKKIILGFIKKYGLNEVITSVEISINQYFSKYDIQYVFDKIEGILKCRRSDAISPLHLNFLYILAVLKNRFDLSSRDRAEIISYFRMFGNEDEDLMISLKEYSITIASVYKFKQLLINYIGD